MAIIDRIKYDGSINGSQWLIHKYPSEQFVLGSQLVVNQGQEALFFKGGEALDLFGPGTHTLSTGNLPFLNKLVNFPFGGKTPFTAEVYYINKTVNLDLKWGTSTPILLEDPKYGLILNVSARGQYGIYISNSRLFVSRIIGAVPNGATTDPKVIPKHFNGLINAKIKSVTAEYMIKKQIPCLEISQYLLELSDVFKDTLSDEFERFGIEIINFYCEAISPSPKDDGHKKLREHKEYLACKIADRISLAGQDTNIICPYCSIHMPVGMKFCGKCGKSINGICPSCQFENDAGMKFCGKCGEKLYDEAKQ